MSKETIEHNEWTDELLAILFAWIDHIMELPENQEVIDKINKH
jgi:hypothetical protein